MSQHQFKKFINPKNNAAIKEKFKQEKKAVKKERAEAINKRFEEKRVLRNIGYATRLEMPSSEQKFDKRQKYPQQINKVEGTKNKAPINTNRKSASANQSLSNASEMPLNKYIAHCGITSRRDAIPLIKEGKVSVNNTVITEPGYKVKNADTVKYNGNKLFLTKNLVYILLNKPKDYITTTN